MATTISELRINNLDPSVVTVYTTLHPVFSWDFDQNAASTSQGGFTIRISTNNTNLGSDYFTGDIINKDVKSSVAYYEYTHFNLIRGTTYYGQIKAWDGEYVINVDTPENNLHISSWNTFQFKVNNLPSASHVRISPSNPTSSDDLTVHYSYSDVDGHEEFGTKIRWYKFGVFQEQFNDLSVVTSDNTTINDDWSAKVIPYDGLEYGTSSESSTVHIDADVVGFSTLEILPQNPNTNDLLKINYIFEDNPYINISDTTVSFSWYINGVLQDGVNTQVARFKVSAGDEVSATISVSLEGTVISNQEVDAVIIQKPNWKIFDLKVDGYREPIGLSDLNPILTWKKYKSIEDTNTLPTYIRVILSKTQSTQSPVYDSGVKEYTADYHQLNSLSRGQTYFAHVGIGDSSDALTYATIEIVTAGSSWQENVNNTVGWTIEFKAKLLETDDNIYQAVSIHDGSKYCLISFYKNKIKFYSTTFTEYDITDTNQYFDQFQVIRITGLNTDCKVFLNNDLVIETTLSSESQAKRLEFGDLDTAAQSTAIWKFFRYSTSGAFNIGEALTEAENEFDFYEVLKISDGTITDFKNQIVSWVPDDSSKSAILWEFNENSSNVILPTVNRNFSPITSIFIDKNNNKYIGSANGVRAIYGSKHDPDYLFDTTKLTSVDISNFDRITNVETDDISKVEYFSNDFLVIDTTAENIGSRTGDDEYEPYSLNAHSIHYLSQRAHGHKWFDNVDNNKGWQVEFTFLLSALEQELFDESNLQKDGVGIYVNDGSYQEIITFTPGTIKLNYANVSASINTTLSRVYRITAQGNNIKIYQRLSTVAAGNEQLLIDGTGLFTQTSSPAANSRNPRITVDNDGNYHAVWNDDSQGKGRILYSKKEGDSWSNPEIVVESAPFTLKRPDICINTDGNIYVVYEDSSYNRTEISVSIRDTIGWNPKVRITNASSTKTKPRITPDNLGNIYVVWEDDRNGHTEIFCATRNVKLAAWNSSAQFGKDTNIVSFRGIDSVITNADVDFHNPCIVFTFPKLYVAYEANFGNTSAILMSIYSTLDKNWFSEGYPQFKSDGTLSGIGTSIAISSLVRNCFNPDIASIDNQVVVVWEDRTESVAQIWGNALFVSDNSELTSPVQITLKETNCKHPAIGGIISSKTASIFFESTELVVGSDGVIENENAISEIFHCAYSAIAGQFFGSATGSQDTKVLIDSDNKAFNPCLPKQNSTISFVMLYDFIRQVPNPTLEDEEHPEFYLVGEAVAHDDTDVTSTTFDTLSTSTIIPLETKEFSIGDISDSLSVKMFIKNLKMYFGYSDQPLSVLNINQSTYVDWPDDRVFNVFTDASGGILAGTFSGLAYFSTINSTVTNVPLETNNTNFIVTAINYSKNGIWYVGTDSNVYFSVDGGQNWTKYQINSYVKDIAIDNDGNAVVATNSGIFVISVNLSSGEASTINHISNAQFKTIAVDEKGIIWAGTDDGLYRIDQTGQIMTFDSANGMTSSHINDIVIVDKATRYIATATGIEKMYGFTFEPINTITTAIGSNNILSITYNKSTNSLWFSALDKLYELVLRDPQTDRTVNELVEYDSEIELSESFDKQTYFILDIDRLIVDSGTLDLTNDSANVFINKNELSFGYTIDSTNKSILFDAPINSDDFVEVLVSNKLKRFKSFDQNSIEKEILGQRKTSIQKIGTTDFGQIIVLSQDDLGNYAILANAGSASVPFTLITIDRDKPTACLQLVEQLSKTQFKFKVLAADETTAVNQMIVSNYENFTSDGTTPLPYVPYKQFITQDIGDTINSVSTSLSIPNTITINNTNYTVGKGSKLASITVSSTTYIYAITTNPTIVFRMSTLDEVWSGIFAATDGDTNQICNDTLVVNNVLYLMTGNNDITNQGTIYQTTNGTDFSVVGTIGNNATCAAVSDDGTLYFGNDNGDIYKYSNGILLLVYSGIGAIVHSMGVVGNKILAATGRSGRIYMIDTSNDDISIVFQTKESDLNKLLITSDSIYAAGTDSTTVYQSNLTDFDFQKVYQSVAGTTIDIFNVQSTSIADVFEGG